MRKRQPDASGGCFAGDYLHKHVEGKGKSTKPRVGSPGGRGGPEEGNSESCRIVLALDCEDRKYARD